MSKFISYNELPSRPKTEFYTIIKNEVLNLYKNMGINDFTDIDFKERVDKELAKYEFTQRGSLYFYRKVNDFTLIQ